ncbi:MAG: S41 family peptidase [Phycisphaerales bacterium]|nr:S41 family peptidase [Phycisphaerales bacterium]
MKQSPESRPSFTRWGNWPVLVLCVLLLGQVVLTISTARSDDLEWFDPLIDVRGMVLQDFVEEPDPEEMQNAAINAMLETLEDPYTVWIPPSMETEFEKQMRGAYVGIGAEIAIENDRLTIVTPLEDSPAIEAGVRAGDVVLEIQGEDTLGLSSNECIERIMGEEGTPVSLLVRHKDGSRETLEVIRRHIRTRTVKGIEREGKEWNHLLDPELGIGYIRVTQFTERTAEELREAMRSLEAQGVKGVVLDLRFNGGGTLDGAIDAADLFLDRGVIVSVRDRHGAGRSWTAEAKNEDIDVPMVVLVNDASASASEIVAGALQENDRAKVLGERTFGKGSVQEVRPLAPGRGILKMTTARYYLPSGRNIDRSGDAEIWGVDPDPGYAIDLSGGEYADLYEARRNYEVIVEAENSLDGRWQEPEWIESEMKDPQLANAIRTLDSRINSGEWLKVGGDSDASTIRNSELIDQIAYRDRLLEELDVAVSRIAELNEAPADGDKENAAAEFTLGENPRIGTGPIELRNANGEIIVRFRAEDATLLEKALRAAGARPEPSEPDTP